jgi:hypothetical protein
MGAPVARSGAQKPREWVSPPIAFTAPWPSAQSTFGVDDYKQRTRALTRANPNSFQATVIFPFSLELPPTEGRKTHTIARQNSVAILAAFSTNGSRCLSPELQKWQSGAEDGWWPATRRAAIGLPAIGSALTGPTDARSSRSEAAAIGPPPSIACAIRRRRESADRGGPLRAHACLSCPNCPFLLNSPSASLL